VCVFFFVYVREAARTSSTLPLGGIGASLRYDKKDVADVRVREIGVVSCVRVYVCVCVYFTRSAT